MNRIRPNKVRTLDINKFNSIRIAENTIEWVTGQDLCPDCLYENSY
jgi:hypothetical protein